MKTTFRALGPLALVLVLTSGCSPTPFKALVRDLAESTRYSGPEIESAFKAANGGKALGDDAAKQLARSESVDKVFEAADQTADIACQAFDLGLLTVDPSSVPDPLERVRVDALLRQMNVDVANATATRDSIDLVCKAKDAAAQL